MRQLRSDASNTTQSATMFIDVIITRCSTELVTSSGIGINNVCSQFLSYMNFRNFKHIEFKAALYKSNLDVMFLIFNIDVFIKHIPLRNVNEITKEPNVLGHHKSSRCYCC